MLKRLLKIVSIIVLFSSLAGCKTSTIVDLIHEHTESVEITEDAFSDSVNDPFMVGGILFYTYTRQTSYEPEYYKYSLKLAAYRKANNSSSVVVNNIKIVGKKDVVFKEINKDLSTPLQFSDDENRPSIQSSDNLLIEEINNYNMKLLEDSELTVVINVTVDVNGEKVTKDLTYDFTTRFRTYAVTR